MCWLLIQGLQESVNYCTKKLKLKTYSYIEVVTVYCCPHASLLFRRKLLLRELQNQRFPPHFISTINILIKYHNNTNTNTAEHTNDVSSWQYVWEVGLPEIHNLKLFWTVFGKYFYCDYTYSILITRLDRTFKKTCHVNISKIIHVLVSNFR